MEKLKKSINVTKNNEVFIDGEKIPVIHRSGAWEQYNIKDDLDAIVVMETDALTSVTTSSDSENNKAFCFHVASFHSIPKNSQYYTRKKSFIHYSYTTARSRNMLYEAYIKRRITDDAKERRCPNSQSILFPE